MSNPSADQSSNSSDSSLQINQDIKGDRNQTIGQVLGGVVVHSPVIIHLPIQKPTGIPNNLPPSGVGRLIGRDQKLIDLHNQLQQNDRIAITAINGMGGIGKTELALQYALTQFKLGTYPGGICWLHARDQEIATQILIYAQAQLGLTIPEQLDLAGQIGYCWRNWAASEVLVILDDVTDYKAVASYLPLPDPRFKVLMTTRLRLGSSFKDFPVEELDEGSAIALLALFVDDERVQSQLDDVKALCQRVGCLPLGLELLGRFLARKPDWTVSRLLEQLASKSLAAKALIEPELGMTLPLGVAEALELSWQELDKPEQKLACLLGLFAVSPIPWKLVEQFLGEIDSDDLEDTRDKGLIGRSLLKRVGQGIYQLHPIVQEYFRYKILNSEKLNTFQGEIAKKIGEIAKTRLAFAIEILESLDILKPNQLNKNKPLSPTEYRDVLREAYKSFSEGFGNISRFISPLQNNGEIAQILIQYTRKGIPKGYKLSEKSSFRYLAIIKTYWYNGNNLASDVTELEDIPKDSIFQTTKEEYLISDYPEFNPIKAYKDAYVALTDKLSDCFNRREILVNEGATADENTWGSAYYLTQRFRSRVIRFESISTSEIISWLDTLKETGTLSSGVNKPSVDQLTFRLSQLEQSGISEIDYPWRPYFVEGTEEALIRACNVYESALRSYELIVKTWFPNQLNDLYTSSLMPVKISGVVFNASNKFDPKPTQGISTGSGGIATLRPQYAVSWFWEVLPTGSQNQVELSWSDKPLSLDDLFLCDLKEKLSRLRKDISHYPFKIYTQDSSAFSRFYPVSSLVYSWLWSDLEKIKLVRGFYNDLYH